MRRARPTRAPMLTPRGVAAFAAFTVAAAIGAYGLYAVADAIKDWIVHHGWRL